MLRLFDSPWANIRLNAVEILGRIGDPSVAPALADLVENDPDSDVQGFAAQALAKLRGVDATRSLVRTLKSKDGGKRTDAVLALARLRATSALPQLAELASQFATANPSLAGLISAATMYVEEGLAGLERILQDTSASEPLRSGAAVTLGYTGLFEAIPVVLAILRDQDEQVRSRALQSLGSLINELNPRDPTLREQMASALTKVVSEDPSRRCRMMAVWWLEKIGNNSTIPLLERIRTADPEPMVRRAAEEALKSLEKPE